MQRLVQSRTSVRRFTERPVAEADILSLVDAARQAPSAENSQPWTFVAVRDPAARAALAKACFSGIFSPTRFAARAPLIVALCAARANLVEAGKAIKDKAMYQIDCGIAGEHLVLRATELGLGTCWIGWFNRRAARRVLRVPVTTQVVSLIAVGYPAPGAGLRRRSRRALASLVWLDAWGNHFPGSEQAPAEVAEPLAPAGPVAEPLAPAEPVVEPLAPAEAAAEPLAPAEAAERCQEGRKK